MITRNPAHYTPGILGGLGNESPPFVHVGGPDITRPIVLEVSM